MFCKRVNIVFNPLIITKVKLGKRRIDCPAFMDGLSIALITFDEKNDRSNCYSIGLSASNFPDGFTEIVEKDLISYWSFDSGKMQGKKVVDGFGKHNGNIQGVLKSVKGKIGEALAFDADKADFAQFDDTKELDLAET